MPDVAQDQEPGLRAAVRDEPPRLTWRNVSTHNLRDFEGCDDERLVARILQEPNGNHDWRWSVFAVCPAILGLTNGVDADPKEARPYFAWGFLFSSPLWFAPMELSHDE